MFRFVILAACVFASAQAGLVLQPGSFAAGPALGAPLLGKVTVNAPETTIVKQQVIVDQPEIRVRHVPTIVQTAPIVKTIQPVVHAAPALTYSAVPAVQTIGAPGVAINGLGYSGLGYNGLVGVNGLGYNGLIGAPGLVGVNGLGYNGLIGAPGLVGVNGLGLNSGLIGAQSILLKK